jgi:DNA-binding NtrC family response regulator
MEQAAKGSGARVLVVDDEPSIRLLCRINLELEGHEVVEAASMSEAREQLGDERIDVVMLDLHLGRETSVELVGECHAHEPPIPVVLVTGAADVLDREPEADAVLPKPFEPQALLDAVRLLSGPAQR